MHIQKTLQQITGNFANKGSFSGSKWQIYMCNKYHWYSKFLTCSVTLIPAKEDNILKQSLFAIEGDYRKNEHPVSHLHVKLLWILFLCGRSLRLYIKGLP